MSSKNTFDVERDAGNNHNHSSKDSFFEMELDAGNNNTSSRDDNHNSSRYSSFEIDSEAGDDNTRSRDAGTEESLCRRIQTTLKNAVISHIPLLKHSILNYADYLGDYVKKTRQYWSPCLKEVILKLKGYFKKAIVGYFLLGWLFGSCIISFTIPYSFISILFQSSVIILCPALYGNISTAVKKILKESAEYQTKRLFVIIPGTIIYVYILLNWLANLFYFAGIAKKLITAV